MDVLENRTERHLLPLPRTAEELAKTRDGREQITSTHTTAISKCCDRSRLGLTWEDEMKTMWNEDPTELLGLEEEGGPFDLAGSEDDEEEDPNESMSFGEDEGDEGDEGYELSGSDEDEDSTEYGSDDDEYEDDDTEETPEYGQRFAGAGIALGLRARRRARLLGVAAQRKRRRARLLALKALRTRRRARLFALAGLFKLLSLRSDW